MSEVDLCGLLKKKVRLVKPIWRKPTFPVWTPSGHTEFFLEIPPTQLYLRK
jgi:hypothetical protein